MEDIRTVYQVCMDSDGESFKAVGIPHTDHSAAAGHLHQTREQIPHAYLASVVYERCAEDGTSPTKRQEIEEQVLDSAEGILDFCGHALRSTQTLQALCNLLGKMNVGKDPLPETHRSNELMPDLLCTITGMTVHLRTILDCLDNIRIEANDLEAVVRPKRQKGSEPTGDGFPAMESA